MADTDSDSAESVQQFDSDGESPVGYTVGIVNNSSDTEQGTPHFSDEDEGSDHVVHSHHYPPPRAYDMTSPPNHGGFGAMLHPITVDDTPLRPLGASRHHESVDLTTPRAAITANITRLTTVERDYELARKLQEEENEDGDRNETRVAAPFAASPTAADADYALAMQLYQTEIEETERTRAEQQRQHLLQLHQQQQQHLQQQQQQLQQQLRLQQQLQGIRYPGRGGFIQATNEEDEEDDEDGYGYNHDHDDDGDGDDNGIPEYPRGILVRRHMGPRAPLDRRHMPANAQLRALMTREIDPNDYDTLLRLDEQTQQKASKSSKETEQLIRGLPRYTWPDKDSASSDSKKRKKPTRQLSITRSNSTTGNNSRKRGRRGEDDDNVESSSSSLTRLPSVVAVGPTAASSQDVTNATTTTTTTATPPQQQQQQEQEEPETCPICLEQFRDGQVICILPCESLHNFHDTCIEHWLRVKAECPIDKSRLL